MATPVLVGFSAALGSFAGLIAGGLAGQAMIRKNRDKGAMVTVAMLGMMGGAFAGASLAAPSATTTAVTTTTPTTVTTGG